MKPGSTPRTKTHSRKANQLMQAMLREVFEGKKEYKVNEQVGMAAEE